jgi:hypothetical protein
MLCQPAHHTLLAALKYVVLSVAHGNTAATDDIVAVRACSVVWRTTPFNRLPLLPRLDVGLRRAYSSNPFFPCLVLVSG